MKHFSLKRGLLVLLLGSVVVVWAIMLGVGYGQAHEEIGELADARMQQDAHLLLALDLKRLTRIVDAGATGGGHGRKLPGTYHHVPPLAFRIWSSAGRPLLASAGAPPAPYVRREGYATRTLDHQRWRSYSTRDTRTGYQITVLSPLAVRDHPTHKMLQGIGIVAAWALPLLALLIWFSVWWGLRPLALLSAAIGGRDADNLAPIDRLRVPTEVEPLVAALNRLLGRLARSLDRERAFTADAAHELRTPLAAIKVQAQVALDAREETTRRQAIEQVVAAVDRTTHLAQQLLTLARLEHVDAQTRRVVNLGEVAEAVVARRAGDADRKTIEVELQAEPDCTLRGDPATLDVLLDNLLDNAIKYGNAGGHIVVNVSHGSDAVVLVVADDGVGVMASDRTRLRDRFFRVEGNAAPGSGLGLSIAERVAAAHGGSIEFGDGLAGLGLGVTVRLSAAR